ncbi:MAG: hypothetical protein K9J79_03085, partial [Desulfobacteraceae bacterium]|nr:hypothetical protein [Desulfobacteraceae bacterium]
KTGMPSRFLDNAYKIDLPQGEKTIKVTTSDAPADQTYESFIQYFREKGWEVRKEMEALEVASKQLKSVPENLEEEVRVAQLSRDGRRMNLGVTRYNNETVAAVWYTTGPDSETAEPEPARSESEKSEKIDASKNLPEEISGSDPEDVPLYPDSIRTSYQKVTEGDKISHLASYGAEADKGKVFNFYEEQLKNKNWEIVKKAETEGKKYLEAARDQDKVRIIIQKSNDYTEIEIAAVYRSKQ